MDEIKPAGSNVRQLKPLSRTEAKKLHALNKVAINQFTDGKDRALRETSAELQRTRTELQLTHKKLMNAAQLLEAVVRRHGNQVFDRKLLESVCARGRIAFDVTDDRIVLKLRDEPKPVDVLTVDSD